MRTIDYLDTNIKTSILNDVKAVAIYHSRHYKGKEAGFFGIPRQVFCYVDYLGQIAYGGKKKNTVNATTFIKEFFPDNYKKYAELLYSMWRHGTVHQYEPISYYAHFQNEREILVVIRWLSNNSNKSRNRKDHLKIFSMEDSNRGLYLVVNICQLVDDLLIALDNFVGKLKKDRSYAVACENRIDRCGENRNYTEIENKIIKPLVKEQIKLAWNSRVGDIDAKGKVIKSTRSK